MTKRNIGIYGNKPFMPYSFPLATPENAGNMIHARAPLAILGDNAIEYFQGTWRFAKDGSFADFVNKRCDGLIVTMANTIRTNDSDGSIYTRFQRMLEKYRVPLTIFGLGARTATEDLDEIELLPECIELLQYLESRAAPIGVRGEFTKRLLVEKAGLKDVIVTGCPSFFSEPAAFSHLRKALAQPEPGVVTYSGTRFDRQEELLALADTARDGGFLIEPVSKVNHRAHLTTLKGKQPALPPYLPKIKRILNDIDPSEIESDFIDLFKNRYRLFHNADSWLDFNRKVVRFGYGTRFHVNMATLLSGKPALWVTHDSRTRELTEFLCLPHIDLKDLGRYSVDELVELADYSDTFRNLDKLFDNWAHYMEVHDLPYSRPRLDL